VPGLGKDRRGFIGRPGHRDDVLAAGDGRDERILAKAAHGQGEALQIIVGQALIGKGQHMMLQPGGTDGGHHSAILPRGRMPQHGAASSRHLGNRTGGTRP
jgi:hypothetical protein